MSNLLSKDEAKSKRTMLIVVAAITCAAILATVAFFLMRRIGANWMPGATSSPQAPQGMVYVPGGEFMMGRDDGDEYERPAHKVTVKPFFIDIHEVTNEDYMACVMAHKCRLSVLPPGWTFDESSKELKYAVGTGRQPVTGVGLDNAKEYAKWVGKRIPKEEEWEFAARGTDGRRYPWGNEWSAGLANADGASNGLAEVGTYKGASPFGAFDMVGNAAEWTDSRMSPYIGGRWIELWVNVDPEKLRSYNLTLEDVAAVFRSQNMEVQKERAEGRMYQLLVLVKSIDDPSTLNGLVVGAWKKYQVKVSDIGFVELIDGGLLIRGGTYLNTRAQATTTYRRNFSTISTSDGSLQDILRNIGFRCVKDIER